MEQENTAKRRAKLLSGGTAIAAFLAILLLVSCLTGTALAWYFAKISSGENDLVGGYFSVNTELSPDISLDAAAADAVPAPEDDGWYTFPDYTEYSLTLTNTGTCHGFCRIEVITTADPDKICRYHTSVLDPDELIELTVSAEVIMLRLTPVQGTLWDFASDGVEISNKQSVPPGHSQAEQLPEDTEQTTEPTENPEETENPEQTTEPTENPEQTTEPTEKPEETAAPTEAPEQTPEPSEQSPEPADPPEQTSETTEPVPVLDGQ